MIRALLYLALMASMMTSAATAGPWPRDEKTGFLSFSLDIEPDDPDDSFVSLYVEYGLSRDRTIGLDRRQNMDEVAKTIAFLRVPFGAEDRKIKLAYEIGAGVVDDHVVVRPGLTLGNGLSVGERSGWWSWDARALIFDELDRVEFKNDVTFGLQMTPRTKFIVQLQNGIPTDSATFAKLAPSLAIKTKKGRHIQLGVTAGVLESDAFEINLGFWQDF